jgi:hypothetical protein
MFIQKHVEATFLVLFQLFFIANYNILKIVKGILVLMNCPQMIRHREPFLRTSWFTSASRTAVRVFRPACKQSAHCYKRFETFDFVDSVFMHVQYDFLNDQFRKSHRKNQQGATV